MITIIGGISLLGLIILAICSIIYQIKSAFENGIVFGLLIMFAYIFTIGLVISVLAYGIK